MTHFTPKLETQGVQTAQSFIPASLFKNTPEIGNYLQKQRRPTMANPFYEVINYYCKQLSKQYFINMFLNNKIKTITQQKQQLIRKIETLEWPVIDDKSGRRHRRTASEIMRVCKCQIEGCGKTYGSQASLIQHFRIKHPQQTFSKEFKDSFLKTRDNISQSQKSEQNIEILEKVSC